MTDATLTRHAEARLQQRGLKRNDVDLITQYGEHVDQGILMTSNRVDSALNALRRQINRLEKLRGRLLIMDGEIVITTYLASKQQIKRCQIG